MKKRRIMRALSLTAALMLALPAAGLAEAAFEPDSYDEVAIAAEAVDAIVESEELELGDDLDIVESEPAQPSAVVDDADETDESPDLQPDAAMIPEDEAVPPEDAGAVAEEVPGDEADPGAQPETAPESTPEAVPDAPQDVELDVGDGDAAPAETSDTGDATDAEAATPSPASDADVKRTPPALSIADMAENIRAAASLGAKADALGNIAELLMDHGFEPAFAAGVCANIYAEGSYGLFERSGYQSNSEHPDLEYRRPKYFCYLDGGNYYTRGAGGYAVTDVYLSPEDMDAYTGSARVHMRYGDENYYLDNWSGRRVWDIDLNELEEFMCNLASLNLQYGTPDAWTYDNSTDTWEYNEAQEGMERWRGKFGLGCAQWTGEEAMRLLALYRRHAGAGSATITKKQAIAAEHEMILSDLQGYYKKVYNGWRRENESALYCPEAAASAGSWVCLKYEIPANREAKAVSRGKRAAEIYRIMVGEK